MKKNKQTKVKLPYQIEYDGRVFLKTRYTATDNKTNEIVYEFRTEDNDDRRIWVFKDGSYYED